MYLLSKIMKALIVIVLVSSFIWALLPESEASLHYSHRGRACTSGALCLL
ncbi:hypothetical protein LJPFL01_0878 [Lelliottia jeotgali]|nr:hypothetical protein LJPFL01_0878 [Lelliottia jeotgali]